VFCCSFFFFVSLQNAYTRVAAERSWQSDIISRKGALLVTNILNSYWTT